MQLKDTAPRQQIDSAQWSLSPLNFEIISSKMYVWFV